MRILRSSKSVILAQNFIWIGVGLSFLYWFLESLMHVTVFGDGNFLDHLFTPDVHELWKRLLVSFLIIFFSVYAQRSINIRRRTEAALADREKELSRILENNPAGIVLVDADSRNIEELHIEPDPERFQPRLSAADIERLEKAGLKLSEYEGMMAEMESGALVIDDISQFETERLIELYHPDIVCGGIKEKYIIQKSGVPMKQLHSYDYSGPYAGFKGAINFYREIDRMVNSKVWKFLKSPWQENPELAAKYAWE